MKRLVVAAAVAASLLGACGGDSPSATPDTVVEVDMSNTAFAPTSVDVKAGELVEFRFHNKDDITHDAFIGTAKEQREHEKVMDDGESMHHHGGASNAVTIKAGKSGLLRRTFKASDDGILIGCHEPGHYASGMRLTINVN